MKITKYIGAFILSVLMLSACESYFGPDANVDPDNPTTATVQVMLPQIQARFAYTYGGDLTRYVGINTQYLDGINRQFAVYQQYGIVGNDVDACWSNLYVGSLNNIKQMVAQSEEAGYNHYVGVGKLMEAFIVLTATDLWGDIPYSDALLFGEQGVYLPTFDSQESVYNAIFERINEGRTALAGDNGGNPPGNDDLIYGGDIDRWLKFANVLEARARIHLAKKDGGSYAAALAALNNGGFESNADNCTFQFGAAPSENAPFFQYIEQRDDCEVAVSFVSLLNGLGDPREAIYGATHDVPGHPVFTPDQNMPMMTFAEQEFIRAEALFGSDKAAAYDAYLAGVAASLAEAGVAEGDATAYLEGSSVAVGASGLTMEHIMVQKYIAIYTNPEAFSDWRRTGYPSLAPHAGSEIPRRLPYSEAELLSNENTPTPAEITIYDRVWWDQ